MFEVASRHIYEFGEFRLDNTRRLLSKYGETVPLTHKAFETLALLVENRGRIVEKDELLREIWPDTFVEEGSLARNISVLRKALGEGPSDHQYIQTIPKQGYRFVASVKEIFEPVDHISDEPVSLNRSNGHGPIGIAESSVTRQKEPRNLMPFAIASGILMAVVVTLIALYLSTKPIEPPTALPAMKVSRFTSTGKALDAAISPDGKYVVYVIFDRGRQSVWVKQVASGSEVQIVEPADVSFQGLAFSTDSNYVYYNVWDKVHVGEIYRVPVLGGAAAKMVNDVMPMMSVSPDNKEIAFVRSSAANNESMLMAARTDGGGERVIAKIGPEQKGWFGGPAWSPDGKSIGFALGGVGEEGQSFAQIAAVSADGGERRILADRRFLGIGSIGWHPNGRDLILSASDQLQMPNQLWRLNTTSGEAARITNDISGYNGLSLTADGRSIVTTQGDFQSNIYIGGTSADSEWKRVTAGRYEGTNLVWTPDGRVLFVSQESGNDDIWIMNADGTGRKRLTNDPSIDASPTISFDSKTVVFVSLRSGVPHIYRMDLDGANQAQLTDGKGEWSPVASPTEPTVIFHSSDHRGEWKMNLDGTGQTRLNDAYTYLPSFSHDGAQLIFNFWDDAAKPEQLRQATVDIKTGQQRTLPSVPKTAIRRDSDVRLKFSPDGTSYAYIDDRDGVSNVWRQPLAGGPPQQITNFNDSYIFTFDWARDGRLAVARGTYSFDVVLITNFE